MAGFGVDRSSVASGSGASASSIPESIIDAKGDLIAGASADTPTRVAVGTNEQRLVADSTQGGGLAWKADTTNYAITAKGELLVGTAADTVAPLSIGAAGEILMPASGASTGAAWLRFPPAGAYLINGKISRSVAASALTLAVKTLADADPSTSSPVYVLMPTATSNVLDGGYTIRSITGALSMVVSSGSTLGHTDATAASVFVYLIDNAGTIEIAASTKFFGGASVQTTTAEGGAGAADSATTLYSTTLRSNVVTACVQRWQSTQTTAGTWAATTGEVAAFPGVGYLQAKDGSAALPSVVVGDEQNGLYSSGSGEVAVSLAGVNAATFASAGLTVVGGVVCATIDGTAVATQTDQEAGTSRFLAVSPLRQQFHPSALKGWAKLTYGGAASASYNVTSVTDTGIGDQGVTWAQDFSSADYPVVATILNDLAGSTTNLNAQVGASSISATFSQVLTVKASDSTLVDASGSFVMVAGDQ